MNYDKNVCVDVSDIIKRLQGKIKLDFEVERMEPLFADQLAYNDIMLKLRTYPLMKVTVIWVLMLVLLQPR